MKDYISGISGLLISLYVYLGAKGFADTSEGLAGNPAMYPQILAILLAILSLIILLQALKEKKKVVFSLNKNILIRVGIFFIALVIYTSLFKYVGFIIPTMIFTIFMIIYLGGTRKQSIGFGIPFAIIVYLAFSMLLKVPLPKGFIGF